MPEKTITPQREWVCGCNTTHHLPLGTTRYQCSFCGDWENPEDAPPVPVEEALAPQPQPPSGPDLTEQEPTLTQGEAAQQTQGEEQGEGQAQPTPNTTPEISTSDVKEA